MVKNLIVIGASTPTIIRVVEDINAAGVEKIKILGFLDNNYSNLGEEFWGYPILGGFDKIGEFVSQDVSLINTIAGSTESRKQTTEFFLKLNCKFTNIVHPRVNINHVRMGTGNLIYENAMIHPFVQIGNHCVISSNSGIAHESIIGDYCFVGPASYICGKVTVGDCAFVGTGSKILPRLSVGNRVIIGAATLVNKNVPPDKKIIGIPGKFV
jgi:sugar O-acyltransferase (sialic acid O-acetyltransferase NeuD family)